jgi:hypothetical protein
MKQNLGPKSTLSNLMIKQNSPDNVASNEPRMMLDQQCCTTFDKIPGQSYACMGSSIFQHQAIVWKVVLFALKSLNKIKYNILCSMTVSRWHITIWAKFVTFQFQDGSICWTAWTTKVTKGHKRGGGNIFLSNGISIDVYST